MKILAVQHLEDCFDGSYIKEVQFNENISEELILKLGILGHLRYYKDFPLPFFKITMARRFEIKGVEGKNSIRIHLNNPNEFNLHDVIDLLTRVECDYPDKNYKQIGI